MNLPQFDGWHLIGAYPDGDPGDVGSWILHHDGQGMLLEVPEGLPVEDVKQAVARLGVRLSYITASHDHEDHLDRDTWNALKLAFPGAHAMHPSGMRGDKLLRLGDEKLYLLKAPKHSRNDVVTVFRGIAMTGDIELGQLASVNDEVPEDTRRRSMFWLRTFQERHQYRVHSIVSAHLNDVRQNVCWPDLFYCH